MNCSICAGLSASFNLTGATMAVGVNQGPNPFTQNGFNLFNGTIGGTLSVTSGSSYGGAATLLFGGLANSITSGNTTVNYYLQQPNTPPIPAGYGLSIGNTTTIQGAVDMQQRSAVPEADNRRSHRCRITWSRILAKTRVGIPESLCSPETQVRLGFLFVPSSSSWSCEPLPTVATTWKVI